MSTEIYAPNQQRIAAQRAWAAKTGEILPSLRKEMIRQSMAGVKKRVAKAGNDRFNLVKKTIAACAAQFGVTVSAPKPVTVLAAFKGVPTDKLSDEIAMAYQLQRHYDLQNG